MLHILLRTSVNKAYLQKTSLLSFGRSERMTARKIAAGLFVSLDGVVEAPEAWHFPT